jgi:muramidase (phage lysozyme)
MTYTAASILAALEYRNARAWLRVIRFGESDETDAAYRRRYHPTGVAYFEDFDRHPQIFEDIPHKPGQRSSAAGAYQITWTTYQGLAAHYPQNVVGFSPAVQDFCAMALTAETPGALAAVLRGDLEAAIAACRPIWTSLPGAEESQARFPMARAKAIFRQWGGELAEDQPATQPPAPIEERPQPPALEPQPPEPENVDPLTVGLISAAINILPNLAKQLIGIFGDEKASPTAQRNAKAGILLLDTVTEAAKAVAPTVTNAQSALEAAARDPAVKAAVESAVREDFLTLYEVGGGIAEARKTSADPTSLAFYKQGSFYISLLLFALAATIVGAILFTSGFTPSDRSQMVTLAVATISAIGGFWLGTSFGSQKKTELLAQK